jgi:NAD(P)-dependent dehydrogenase (short-subunit alcohol dehydrogenase family)
LTRVAAVTGASAGIGRAVAVALGALGWTVGVGARRVGELEKTAELVEAAGGRAVAHPLDVADTASVDAFCAAVGDTRPIDVLVNNAGTAAPGAVHEMPEDVHRRIVETNLLGAILVTRRVVADLRAAGGESGDVVFVSSDATVRHRPALATYLATKAGLEAFAATLALECEGTGIRSSVVRVGPTLTGFADSWDMQIFETLLPRWQRFGIQRHFATMQPEDVARAVVQVVTAPPHVWVPIVEVQPNPPVE